MNKQKRRKLENKQLKSRLLVLFSLLGLTKKVKKLFRENGIKKYHLNDLIFYVKKKDFKVNKIKILQQGIETTPDVITGYRRSKLRVKALILSLK